MGEIRNVGARMIRAHLDDIPQHEAPASFSIRRYRPGDEVAWTRIHEVADIYNTFSSETFTREFGSDAAQWAARQYYLCNAEGEAIGTGTAWFTSDDEGDCGLVHWIAVHPDMQDHGLSKPLLTAVCNRLRALGYTRARLSTSTGRLPALCLYLGFGFVPVIETDEVRFAWRAVRERLGDRAARYPVLMEI